jgi:hypothetical protein
LVGWLVGYGVNLERKMLDKMLHVVGMKDIPQ